MMRVLVACEFSGRVREAFRRRGHDAFSCDLLPSLDNSEYHVTGNVEGLLEDGWDLIIAHPPCTYLAVSGNKHYSKRPDLFVPAAEFAMMFMNCAPKVCIENPIGRLSTFWRKPDQIIQPWMFGHGETKATCLWLKGLPKLIPTNIVEGREQRIFRMPPSKERSNLRSITFEGVAEAMASQWG